MIPIVRAGMIAVVRGLSKGKKSVKYSKHTKEYEELPNKEDTKLRKYYDKLEKRRRNAKN